MGELKKVQRRQWISQYDNVKESDIEIIGNGDSDKNSHNAGSSSSSSSSWKRLKHRIILRPKRHVLWMIPVLVLVGMGVIWSEEQRHLREYYVDVLRRRGLLCYKTPYLSAGQAVRNMPDLSIPSGGDGEKKVSLQGVRGYDNNAVSIAELSMKKPTYVTLCEELTQRNKNTLKVDGSGEVLQPLLESDWFVLREHEHVCRDWANPHESLMDMIASQVVAYAGRSFGLKYDHDCHKFMSHQNKFDFDVTTIQEIYPQLPLRLDERMMGIGDVVWNLCESCVQQYKSNNNNDDNNNDEVTPHAHHCLLFPEPELGSTNDRYDASRLHVEGVDNGGGGELNWDGRKLNHEPYALEAVLRIVKNRLYHAAIDYSKKSDIPDHDPRAGATIYIDQQSLAIPYRIFVEQMPSQAASHISVLVGPKCVDQVLRPTNIQCLDYATQLREYLEKHFAVGDNIVSFNIVASTATLFSRLILTHNLLCPPGTIPCLLTALSRQSAKETIIIENVEESKTFHFFSQLSSHADNIKVIPLSSEDMMVQDQDQISIAKNTPLNNIPQRVEGNPNNRFKTNSQGEEQQQQQQKQAAMVQQTEGTTSRADTEMNVETGLVNIGGKGYGLGQEAPKPIDLSVELKEEEAALEKEENKDNSKEEASSAGTSASSIVESMERKHGIKNFVQAREGVDNPMNAKEELDEVSDEQFDLAFDEKLDGGDEIDGGSNFDELFDGTSSNHESRFGDYRKKD